MVSLDSRTLRDFGFGRSSMDDLIQDEVKDFGSFLEQNKVDKPIATRDLFHIPILSSLWTIVTGERASRNDPTLVRVMESMIKSFEVEKSHDKRFIQGTDICLNHD